MAISSVIAFGSQGIQTGILRTQSAAGRIANPASDLENSDYATAMVGLKSGEIQVKASAAVVKTGDQMLGALLDIRA